MINNLRYQIKQVTWQEVEQALTAIRLTVFVDEQNVPKDLEIDGLDAQCIHVMATDATNKPIGTARMLDDGHIGRMAVLIKYRNNGIGSALLSALIKIAKTCKLRRVYLYSQLSAVTFYQKHEFSAYGKEFMDAGIIHVSMQRTLFS